MPVMSLPLPHFMPGTNPLWFPIRIPFPMMRISSILPYSLNGPLKSGLLALFELAWSNKIQLPILITVCFMAFDIRLQLEINIFWENPRPRDNTRRERERREQRERERYQEAASRAVAVTAALLQRQRQRLERQRLLGENDSTTGRLTDLDDGLADLLDSGDEIELMEMDEDGRTFNARNLSENGGGGDAATTRKLKRLKRKLAQVKSSLSAQNFASGDSAPTTTAPLAAEEDSDTDDDDDVDTLSLSSSDDEDEDGDDDDDSGASHGQFSSPRNDFFDDDEDRGADDDDGDSSSSSGGGTPLVVELEIRQRPTFKAFTGWLLSSWGKGATVEESFIEELVPSAQSIREEELINCS